MVDYLVYVQDTKNIADDFNLKVISKCGSAIYVLRSLYENPTLPSGHEVIGYDNLTDDDYSFINGGKEKLESVYDRDEGKPIKPYSYGPVDNESLALIKSKKKLVGVEYGGFRVSLNEANQNGIASILKACELASKYEKGIFPFTFHAESESGISKLEFSSLQEFEVFALTFMSERQKFFN